MRYGADHKKRTRDRVLDAAAAALRARGPHRVTVGGVMADAGLTHGAFYGHFGSKDDLIAETIREMFGGVLGRLESQPTVAGARQTLRGYIGAYLSAEHRDATRSGCPLAALSGDLGRLPAPARARAREGHERVLQRIEALLEAAGDPEPRPLAMSVMAELVGALLSARALGTGAESDEALEASRTHLLSRLGLEGTA